MKFTPKFTITNQLLANIVEIRKIVMELNNKQFPSVVLLDLELQARAVSSYASTSIEGNPLPLTEVKKILKSQPINMRDTEKEVLNYNKALGNLNKIIKQNGIKLDHDLLLSIHKLILDGLLPDNKIGKYRNDPVIVNNPRTREVVYLPPDSEMVEDLMNDLLSFIDKNRRKIDPIILAGLFHKQFVIIHPFIDGNGRTSRLATKVLLASLGLNTFNLFSFENYYNNNVTRYFEKVGVLGNYYEIFEDIDFTNWLEYFSEGIIDEIMRVRKILDQKISTPENALTKEQEIIIKYIKKKGYITDHEYSLITKRAKATRVLDFNKLIKLGVIERKGVGRKTFYVLKE